MLYRQSKCELAKVNCCDHLDNQLPWSLWLGQRASWSHQTWHAHGQRMGVGAGVVRFIVSCRGRARHTNALPAKLVWIGQSELLWPLGPPVALVALARPAGILEPPNLACSWPGDRSRRWRCPFYRILSWAGASHQCSTGKVNVNWPKWTAVTTWTTSCLGRFGSACRQAGATKLGMPMARELVYVLGLSVLSYLVVGLCVTPMLYRQS